MLTYSDSSSYRPQNDIDSIEKLLAKVEYSLVVRSFDYAQDDRDGMNLNDG